MLAEKPAHSATSHPDQASSSTEGFGVEQLERGKYTEYDEDSLPQFLADVEPRQRDSLTKKSEGQ